LTASQTPDPADQLIVGLAGTSFAVAADTLGRIHLLALLRGAGARWQTRAVRPDADVPGGDFCGADMLTELWPLGLRRRRQCQQQNRNRREKNPPSKI
jgi:hypothetical protein